MIINFSVARQSRVQKQKSFSKRLLYLSNFQSLRLQLRLSEDGEATKLINNALTRGVHCSNFSCLLRKKVQHKFGVIIVACLDEHARTAACKGGMIKRAQVEDSSFGDPTLPVRPPDNEVQLKF